MCGRYSLMTELEQIVTTFDIDQADWIPLPHVRILHLRKACR